MAYDTFLGTSVSGANTFEVMVWLGLYGGVSPLSANGYPFTPIASPTIGGVAFDLAYGLNGAVKVYSFVAHSHAATSFSGNLVSATRALPLLARWRLTSSLAAQFLPIPRAKLRQQWPHLELVPAEHPGWLRSV